MLKWLHHRQWADDAHTHTHTWSSKARFRMFVNVQMMITFTFELLKKKCCQSALTFKALLISSWVFWKINNVPQGSKSIVLNVSTPNRLRSLVILKNCGKKNKLNRHKLSDVYDAVKAVSFHSLNSDTITTHPNHSGGFWIQEFPSLTCWSSRAWCPLTLTCTLKTWLWNMTCRLGWKHLLKVSIIKMCK